MRKLWFIPLVPAILFCIGAFLNILVVTVNRGVMPVLMPVTMPAADGTILDPIHITWNAHVHLAILCDWIQINDGVCSIGDLFLWLGEFLQWPVLVGWAAYHLMKSE